MEPRDRLHAYSPDVDELSHRVADFVASRLRGPIVHPNGTFENDNDSGRSIATAGRGSAQAFELFLQNVLARSVVTSHPNYLAYVPSAPSAHAVLFDLAVSASGLIGSGWIDGAGAIWAENEALRWIADLIGFDAAAGGCFVSGGSAGNLSALVAARHATPDRRLRRSDRRVLLASGDTHPSIEVAARILDVELVRLPVDPDRQVLSGDAVRSAIAADGAGRVFAVVATAGTTGAGLVDDLEEIGHACRSAAIWLHVDAAYGGAALCSPSARGLLRGIDQADSVIVDPHKWLFAPYDSCALIYAQPELVAGAFAQEAGYLTEANECGEWNPMHYAFHLTRRPRGLPLWFSLVANGTDAYRDAIDAGLDMARSVAGEVVRRAWLELVMKPTLSIVIVRRRGWQAPQYRRWCEEVRSLQMAFVVPADWRGEPVIRMCFVNPLTRLDDVCKLLDSTG